MMATTGNCCIYFQNKEDELLQNLDKKLELEQTLKIFQYLPIEGKELYKAFTNKTYRMEKLLLNEIISSKEFDLLFPESEKSDFTQFGWSLLHVLIFTFCELPQPASGWNDEPVQDDESESSCYVRIMLARKMIEEALHAGVILKDVQKIFNFIRPTLIQLGNDEDEVNELLPPERYDVFPPVSNFTGRQTDLSQVHDKLLQSKLDKKMGLVLRGDVCIGKTELIRKYCEVYSSHYSNNIIWLDASTKYSLSFHLRSLAIQLGLPVKNDQGNFLSAKSIFSSVNWFFENTNLLYVFDNVQSSHQVMKFLSNVETHFIIIISRGEFPLNKFVQYILNPMSPEDANVFFKKGLHISNDPNQARTRHHLAVLFNRHPYAMTLAMAYMKETNTKVEEYVNLLKQVIQDRRGGNNDEGTFPVDCAFNITFNYVIGSDLSGLAAHVFNFLSFLDGQQIDITFLRRVISTKFQESYEITKLFKKLLRLMIIQFPHHPGSKVRIRISSYIQEAIKFHPGNGMAAKREAFENLMHSMFQNVRSPYQLDDDDVEKWLPHFLHISKTKDFYSYFLQICIENQVALLEAFSNRGRSEDLMETLWELENHFLNDKGVKESFVTKMSIAKAYELLGGGDEALIEYKSLLEEIGYIYEENDWIAVHCRFELAASLYRQKKYEDAFEICKNILAIKPDISESLMMEIKFLKLKCSMKKRTIKDIVRNLHEFESTLINHEVHEKNSVTTSYSLMKLKLKLYIAKYTRLDGGADNFNAMYEEVEEKYSKILGNCDRRMLKVKMLQASHYFQTDQIDKALMKNSEILLCQTFTLGECHTNTLRTKYQIGKCLQKLEDYDTAEKIYKMVENLQKIFLTPDHLEDLVNTKDDRANCLYQMGRYEEALIKYREKEELHVSLLGHFDSEVLKTKHAVAVCLHSCGKLHEAISLYKQIESTQTKLLGKASIDTLRTGHNLCVSLLDGGKENIALLRFLKLEKAQSDSLGCYHPDVLTTQHNIAVCLHKKKFFDFAIQKYSILESCLNDVMGDADVNVLKIKHNMAVCLHENNQLSSAFRKYEEVLELQTKLLGAMHPDVLATRYNIAVCYHDNKNLRGAVEELEEIEKLQCEALGEKHPDVNRTRSTLSVCRKEVELWGDLTPYCTIL